MAFVNDPKNSSSFNNNTPNSSTYSQNMRHGKDLGLDVLSDKVFTDTIFDGDATQIKDFTFDQIGTDQQYTNDTKH